MTKMDTVFANTNFADEAEQYVDLDINRYELEDAIRILLAEFDPTEDDIKEYTDKLMDAIEFERGGNECR